MADKYQYTSLLVEALMYSTYFNLSGGENVHAFPPQAGVPFLLSTIGLSVRKYDNGVDILDRRKPIVRIRIDDDQDFISLYIEPAELLFKAFSLINQPYSIKSEVL